MDLEQVEPLVDGIVQAELADEGVDGADAPVGDAVGSPGDLVMDVAGSEDGAVTIGESGGIKALLEAALAGGEFLLYRSVHSKSLRFWLQGDVRYSIEPRKRQGISSSSTFFSGEGQGLRLLKG
jgi:hypothetical protein